MPDFAQKAGGARLFPIERCPYLSHLRRV